MNRLNQLPVGGKCVKIILKLIDVLHAMNRLIDAIFEDKMHLAYPKGMHDAYIIDRPCGR
jgi:hypothetical protein